MSKIIKQISKSPEVYVIPFPKKTNDVYIDVYFKEGSYDEYDNKQGLLHLLEHYLLASFDILSKYSIYANAGIMAEKSHFYIEGNKREIKSKIDFFFKSMFDLRFDNKKILEQEKLSIINELNARYNKTDFQTFNKLREVLFGESSSATRNINKEIKNIKRFTLEDCKEKYDEILFKSNIKIFIGAYKPDKELTDLVINTLNKYKLKNSKLKEHIKPKITKKKYSKAKLPGRRGKYVYITFPGYSLKNKIEDRFTQYLFNKIFVSSSENTLFKKLREEGIYSVHYNFSTYKNFGLTSFYSHVDNEYVDKFIDVIKSALSDSANNGFKKNNINKTKKSIIETSEKRWKDNSSRYADIIHQVILEEEVITLEKDREIFRNIDNNKLKKVAKNIFDFRKAKITVIG